MLINNLDKMEKIVSSNKNLYWDGWNVIHIKPSSTAMFQNNGIFIKDSWYTKTTYSPDRDGWNIKKEHLGI